MDEAGITFEQAAAMLGLMPEPQPVFWRLYHNAEGYPICYSMEHLPGNYIDVDAETFARGDMRVRVIDNKLKLIKPVWGHKLVPTDQGTACHPNNVAVVVNNNQQHQCWSKKIYESH